MSILGKIIGKTADAVHTAEKAGTHSIGRSADLLINHNNVLRYDEEGLPSGFNKKGKLALAGIFGASTFSAMDDERAKNNMGTADGRIYTATPDYSSYAKSKGTSSQYQGAPAGADGSLVFALDRAKNGGYL